MKLEDLQPNASALGILVDALVTVVSIQCFGSEALELTYKTPAGKSRTLLYRDGEPRLEIVEVGRPWSFDCDDALFRLVSGDCGSSRCSHFPMLIRPGLLVKPDVARKLLDAESRRATSGERGAAGSAAGQGASAGESDTGAGGGPRQLPRTGVSMARRSSMQRASGVMPVGLPTKSFRIFRGR